MISDYALIPNYMQFILITSFLPSYFQIQRNTSASLLAAFKAVGEQKGLRLDGEALQKANVNLILPLLSHANPLLRFVLSLCFFFFFLESKNVSN